MKDISHWSVRYLYDRIAFWIYQYLHPDEPWLVNSAIAILDSCLKDTDKGIEFGSGRSTHWFASRVNYLVSVESNRKWYEKVNEDLIKVPNSNTDYYFRDTKEEYVSIASKYAQGSLDFALIDGEWRSSCALAIIDKIKSGGFIIVDNANWFIPSNTRSPASRNWDSGFASEEWKQFYNLVCDWRLIWTSNGVTDTALYFKK